jgi:hypothetical protein
MKMRVEESQQPSALWQTSRRGMTMKRLLKSGDRIKLKVATIGGWKGTATVTENQLSFDDTVHFRPDGSAPDDWISGRCVACRHEVSLLRNQSIATSTKAS